MSSFNWTQIPVRLLRRNAYELAMKEYERQITEEVSAKNRAAQQAAVAPNRGWMHHISSENNKADSYRIAWEITMQKLQQQERQKERDAQAQAGQFWGDMQQKAQANLAKDSLLMGMSEPDRQRKVAEETYRLASQQFQAAGDYESAEESERRMRIAQGLEPASEQDYQTGLVRQVAPTAEQIQTQLPQENRVKDFWDAVRVAVVSTAKSLAQSPSTVASTYIVGDQGEKTLAGIGAGAYAESYRRGETPQQMKERMAPLSDVDKRMLDTLGEYGAKIQTEYDDWYQSHPELWERPEYQKTPTELWKTDKKTFLDPFYWGTKSAQSSIYTFGALVAGGLGYAMGGVTGAAIGAYAYTYPLMTQYSYEAAIEAGADRTTALEIAGVVGPATALLETSTDVFMVWSIAGLKHVFVKKATEEMSKQVVKNMVKQKVIGAGLKRAFQITGGEVFTENMQDVTTNAGIKTFNENKKVFEGLGDTTMLTVAATMPFALLGGGGAMVNTQQQNKVVEFQIEVQRFIEEEQIAKAREAEEAARRGDEERMRKAKAAFAVGEQEREQQERQFDISEAVEEKAREELPTATLGTGEGFDISGLEREGPARGFRTEEGAGTLGTRGGFDVSEVINETAEFAERTAQRLGIEVDVEGAKREAQEAVRTVEYKGTVSSERVQATAQVPESAMGNETVAYDPDGRAYNLRFAVVDLNSLVASHTDAFEQNPAYPPELQPRDRGRAANVQQVNQIVTRFHPEQVLVNSRDLGTGSPVIGGDLVVESGNGRVLALRRLQRENPQAFKEYQSQLQAMLGSVGVDPKAAEGMKAPVLVRVSNIAGSQRAQFASIANQRATLAMSPFEQALEDSKRISAQSIARLTINENESIEQALRKPANQQLGQELAANLSATERAAITDQDGYPNAAGVERLKWAIFAKTFSGKAGERLVRVFSESIDPVVKNIQTAMFQSLPQLAQAEALVHSGQRDAGLSIAPHMANVVEVYAGLKQSGMLVADYLRQASMFDEQLSPLEKRVLEHLDALGERSPKPFREFLRSVAQKIQNAPQVGQGTLIQTVPVTLEEVINDAITQARSAADTTANVGGRPGLFEEVPGMGTPTRGGVETSRGTRTEATDQSGRNIGGGEAYNAIGRLLDIESSADIANRLFGNIAEQRLMTVLSKLPGGQSAAHLVSKVGPKRSTLEEQAVVEKCAEALDIAKRRADGIVAIVVNTIRANFPKGDVVKHLGIDERGIAHNVVPKPGFTVVEHKEGKLGLNEVSLHWNDVMHYPERFQLDAPTSQMLVFWKQLRHQIVELLRREGIDMNEEWFVENYFPRMVRQVQGTEFVYPHVDFMEAREYSTALEAIDNEVGYVNDPVQTIASCLREVHLVVASHRLSTAIREMGQKPSERVPSSIRYAREIALRDWQRAVRAELVVQRARRGEQIPPATIAMVGRLSPELARGIESLMTSKERTRAGAALVLQAREIKMQKKALVETTRAEYAKALSIARKAKPWKGEDTYRGLIVSKGVRDVLREFEGSKVPKLLAGTAEINDVLRTMVASMDFSSLMIQNLLLLGRPRTFARVALKSFEVLVHPEAQYSYVARPDNVAYLQRHPDTKVGITHEYAAGVHTLESIPIAGKYLAKPLKPFERFFGFSGDMARIEMGKVMEPVFVNAGMPGQVGTFVNRMTGVMNTEALGISAQQRAVERLLFFAPQYTRACLAYIGYVGQNNVMGHEALKSFGRLYAVGTAMYVSSCLAMGQEPQLDPTKPTFYTIKVGNRHIGIGGFQYSFLRFMADSLQSISRSGGNKPVDFTKFDRKENPILKWLYSRSSPTVSLAIEGATRRDYLGYPLEDMETWAHWLVVEHMFPIGLQEQIPSRTQEAPTDPLAIAMAESIGMRTFEVEPFYELANEYAAKHYGKEWSQLYKPTKSGTYAMSEEQKRLLTLYPDLKSAYDAWKPMQTRKWQAEHGLLPNEDAINDYYARQVFNREWSKLTRQEKQQVKQYREFAEEAETVTSVTPSVSGVKPPSLRRGS